MNLQDNRWIKQKVILEYKHWLKFKSRARNKECIIVRKIGR